MAVAYRNKFEAKCEATGVMIPVGQGWVHPIADKPGGAQRWRAICDDVATREGHRKVDTNGSESKRGGQGVTTKLDVASCWAKVFEDNEARNICGEKPWTDDEISKFMMAEFPYSSPDSKSTARVRMFRSNFNRSAHSFAGRKVPNPQSREYDSSGKPVEGTHRAVPSQVDMAAIAAMVKDVAEKSVRDLLAKEAKPVVNISFEGRKAVKVDAAGKNKAFTTVLKRVEAGLPVLLVGPTGSGKTHLAKQVADALGMDFTFNSMSEGVSESSLLGRMLPASKGSEWVYKDSPFVRSYRDGGVHLLDEIDAADPNLLVTVNAAIANGFLSLPFADAKPIKRHKDSVIIAAANTYGNGADRMYVGRNQLDAATINRFVMGTVEVDYDRDVERAIVAAILPQKTDAARRQLEDLTKWAWGVRDSIGSAKLRRSMSTRNIEDAAKLLAVGVGFDEIKKTYFLGWSDDEARRCATGGVR